jgi:hypothetical protein
VAQRVGPLSWVETERFQRWLRALNAAKYNVFVSVNAMTPGRQSRTRDAVGGVRHVFLDADHDGAAVLSRVKMRSDLPSPSYILRTSPDHVHILWRVLGFDCASVERLQKQLSRELQTDPAATPATQNTRLPGLLYLKPPIVVMGEIRRCCNNLTMRRCPVVREWRRTVPSFSSDASLFVCRLRFSGLKNKRVTSARIDRDDAVLGRLFTVCKSATCGDDENESDGESTQRHYQFERYGCAGLRVGEQPAEESRHCVEDRMHGDGREDAETSQIGPVRQDDALAYQEEHVDPQRRTGPPGIQEERQVPPGPEEAEDQRATDWSERRLKTRQCVSSPARLFTKGAAEERRVVVDRQRRQDAPLKFSWVGGRDSRQDHVRDDHQCHAGGRGTDRPQPCRVEAKRSVIPRGQPMRDQRRDGWSKCRDGGPLQSAVKDHQRHENEPCPDVGDREKDDQCLWRRHSYGATAYYRLDTLMSNENSSYVRA